MDVSRRHLMGFAATAAGVLGSATLFGCEMNSKSEATPPPPPAAPAAGPRPGAAEAPSAAGPAAAKQTKAEAMYQDHPKGSERCGLCANFIAPNDCRVIQGPVNPEGWCKNFRLRA